jgi:hypothetical protein
VLFTFSLLRLFGEDPEPDEKTLKALKNILKLEIEVNLLQQDQKVAWNTKGSKYTIPGKPVNLKIEGNNIKLYGSFTPYYDANGNLVLLAQGQIFISSSSGKEFRYFSYFKSIRAILGDKLVFFPLGFMGGNSSDESTNIEIDIMISPYNTQVKENNK